MKLHRFLALKIDDMTVDQVAFAVQKDSEFKQVLNYQLMKMKNNGVMAFLESKWLKSRRPPEEARLKEEASPLGNNLFIDN